jgi:galactosamine-6-phosphate isomerase
LHWLSDLDYTLRMREAGDPRIQVAMSYEAMSREAATIISAELRQKPDLLLCCSAGGTPTLTYQLLAAECVRTPQRFSTLRVLQIDEWAGLPRNYAGTCWADLRRKVVEPLRISPGRFTGFRTDVADREAECYRVARWLARNGPIDICILGLGGNGHVAMNEPAEVMTPGVHVAKLARSSRAHSLLKDLPRKPTQGLTLGIGDILRSKKILLLVSGSSKRQAVKRLRQPRVTGRFPASFLWLHPAATVLCDREAIAEPDV